MGLGALASDRGGLTLLALETRLDQSLVGHFLNLWATLTPQHIPLHSALKAWQQSSFLADQPH